MRIRRQGKESPVDVKGYPEVGFTACALADRGGSRLKKRTGRKAGSASGEGWRELVKQCVRISNEIFQDQTLHVNTVFQDFIPAKDNIAEERSERLNGH